MNTYTQMFAGVSLAGALAVAALFAASQSSPLFANVAAANYGGGDVVTICHLDETIEVDAAAVAGYVAQGAQLGACSDDAGLLTISKVHLQKYSATQDWVELYNPSNQPVSLAGWELCNANSCDSLGSGSVAPGEYVLVAGNPTIHTEISIPWGVELVLVGDGEVGSDLMHYADIVKLRGSDGVIVDQMNWGTPQTSWPNYNEAAWNGLPGVHVQVLARTTSTDTNTPADWAALGVPEVSLGISGAANATYLFPGETVTIDWGTVNPNGSDSDLTIDLYWFDENDGINLIELGTDNDGEYEWTVPNNVETVRVKIVATSPSNPLLNARDITAEIPLYNNGQ